MYQNIHQARNEDQYYSGKYIYNKVPPYTETHRPLESCNKRYNKSTSVRLSKTNISSQALISLFAISQFKLDVDTVESKLTTQSIQARFSENLWIAIICLL